MTADDYQIMASRTINQDLTAQQMELHALHGMVGEIGEIHSMYQKLYQGHKFDRTSLKKELGDLCWFIAEFCEVNGWYLDDVLEMNIEKLRARYPDGFESERSVHRDAEDE